MSCALCQSTASRKDAFETAKIGVDPSIVLQVMKGLPISEENTDVRELRIAWSRYHQYLRC